MLRQSLKLFYALSENQNKFFLKPVRFKSLTPIQSLQNKVMDNVECKVTNYSNEAH